MLYFFSLMPSSGMVRVTSQSRKHSRLLPQQRGPRTIAMEESLEYPVVRPSTDQISSTANEKQPVNAHAVLEVPVVLLTSDVVGHLTLELAPTPVYKWVVMKRGRRKPMVAARRPCSLPRVNKGSLHQGLVCLVCREEAQGGFHGVCSSASCFLVLSIGLARLSSKQALSYWRCF